MSIAPATAAPAPLAVTAPRAVAPSVQQAVAAQVLTLEKRIQGRIGVAFRLVETGETGAVAGAERFPMASTVKVAIAGTLLSLVDKGEMRLDRMVTVTQGDVDRTGEVANRLIHPGVVLSVANLMELMLTQSNNTATDKILALAGGPTAVTAWLRARGITDIQVDRDVNDLLNEFYGVPAGSPFVKTIMARGLAEAELEKAAYSANAAFEQDPRDTSGPSAMVDLLGKLLVDPLLKPESRAFLLGVMERCETGQARLKGILPAGTKVAHKTGTIGGTINDVGMITLPGNRGRLLIAVYTKGSSLPAAQRERAIAEISRSLFDYFATR
ncbi:MAG: class A beta-lactamase [Candidatus Sphingomonas colombiensis]|nr:class A beta-lactamase [Sphingomonas sp.]WEK45092.1 MAG: class A beta-lactamase [Sphingomonas sp.]